MVASQASESCCLRKSSKEVGETVCIVGLVLIVVLTVIVWFFALISGTRYSNSFDQDSPNVEITAKSPRHTKYAKWIISEREREREDILWSALLRIRRRVQSDLGELGASPPLGGNRIITTFTSLVVDT